MSLSRTKAQLIKLLEDRDNRVLALSGQWGTGKSYMWDEIQRTSNDEQVQKCLYVSLFGVGSINDLKLKLISSTTPQEKNINPLWSVTNALNKRVIHLTKILEPSHKALGVVTNLELILALTMLLKRS